MATKTRTEMIQESMVKTNMAIREMENALNNLLDVQKVVGGEPAINAAIKALDGNILLNQVGIIDRMKSFYNELIEIAAKEEII